MNMSQINSSLITGRTASASPAVATTVLDAVAATPPSANAPAVSAAGSVSNGTLASPAAPLMTAAAAARAKKLAAGGMDFVERPGQVYVPSSARNLAPPPVPAATSAPALPAVPPPPSFSFIRWYCTARGHWVWVVRGFSVAASLALAYLCFRYYQSWRAKMERRLAMWREKDKLKLESIQSSSSSHDASSIPASTNSTVDSIGSDQFHALTSLISARYQQLQSLYPALIARQQQSSLSASSQTENEQNIPNATDDSLTSPTRQFAFMMDLLGTTLKENEYYRDLLARIRTQMKK